MITEMEVNNACNMYMYLLPPPPLNNFCSSFTMLPALHIAHEEEDIQSKGWITQKKTINSLDQSLSLVPFPFLFIFFSSIRLQLIPHAPQDIGSGLSGYDDRGENCRGNQSNGCPHCPRHSFLLVFFCCHLHNVICCVTEALQRVSTVLKITQ